MLPLENPLQTSAFSYPKSYSSKSPKFSRAMAMRIGDHVTTWISGTASIVNAETMHIGDVEKQTEQTLTNIERLIDAANFEQAGWSDAGATMDDLAKIRVYVKHHEDYREMPRGLRAASRPHPGHLCPGRRVPPGLAG